MPEGRRILNVQKPIVELPKREDLPKLTKKQLAELIYDFYIEINITDPQNGVGKEEWVRRMLNGSGAAQPAKKDELVRQLGSILDDRENDLNLINGLAQGDELVLSSVMLAHRFSRNVLETELDARDDTAIPDERNASLSGYSTEELADVVKNYRAYRRPEALQKAQAMTNFYEERNAINYRAFVEQIIENEYENRPSYMEGLVYERIHSFFARQREEDLEDLDERQYKALYQSHLDGDNLLENLGQEYNANFEGRITSDEDVQRLIEQYTYTFYSDVLIDRNEPTQEDDLRAYLNNGLKEIKWLDGRLDGFTEDEISDLVNDLKPWFENSKFVGADDFDEWYDEFAEERILPLLNERRAEDAAAQYLRETKYGSPIHGIAEVPAGSGKYVAVIDNRQQKEDAFPDQYPPSFIIAHDYNPTSGEWQTGAFGFSHYEEARDYYKASYNVDLGDDLFPEVTANSASQQTAVANRETLKTAIQKEFDDFRAEEFKKSASEVFADMLKIHFYTEVSNFLTADNNLDALSDDVVNGLVSETPNALSLLYDYYLKMESYSVDNSNQVHELINNYAEDYYPQNGIADSRTAEELLQEPLYGVCYNWKGLKEENTVYTAAQLQAEDPDFNPELDVQDGAFAANKTYIVYKLDGATAEETAANVKAFMTGSKNDTFEGGNMPEGWYWETIDMNLFTGEYNPTAKKLIEHFGLTDADLRMQEPEPELSPLEKLKIQAAEYVKSTGKPHVLIEWSENGAVPNETIMTFEDADRLLRSLNFAFQDVGYDKTKLHIFYQDGENVEAYGELRYDIGTERAGLVEHIEDYANNSDLVTAGFTNAEEQKGRLHVANILKEYMQGIYTIENLETEVQRWRDDNYENFRSGKITEYKPFPNYMAVPYNEFSEASGWGCAVEELNVWGKEHQKGTPAQKQWIEDYLEDINFHTANSFLHEGKYDEFFNYVEQERIEHKLEEIRQQGVSLQKLETRINLASTFTANELHNEISARNGTTEPILQKEIAKTRSKFVGIDTEDLIETYKNYSVYSSKHAPTILRVYKNFALPTAEELAAKADKAAAQAQQPVAVQEEQPKHTPKQKQNIKTVLGGKYNADELQKYLTKELEENALKNAQSEKEFLTFLASFRSRQYSVRNQLMLYIQAAQNGYMPIFGTFEEWKGKGTSIQPGTHGLTICRPIFTDVYYEEVNVDGEIKKQRYVKFATTKEKLKELEEGVKAGKVEKKSELTHFIYTDSVFSMSQTTMTEEQRIEYLQRYNALNTSTENAELYEKLKAVSEVIGRPVVEKPIKGEELGWVERAENGEIVIKADMPIDAKISVLAHEIGHKLLHIQNATAENRAQKEVQAQLFSHLAMLKLGIDAEKQFSLSYINSWIKASEKNPPVFDANGRELSKGEVLQLNLAAVIPAVDALLKAVGEKTQPINEDAVQALKDYKAEQAQPEQRQPAKQKEGKVEIEPLRVVKQTDKAVMVKIPGANPEDKKTGVWLPRSCISVNKDGYVYEATPSVIKEKGLTPKAALTAKKGAISQRSFKI